MRVIVADDSVLLREGLVRLLAENGHDVVAQVGDGPSFVTAVREFRPDASIVDVRMPPSHTDEGLRAAVAVRREIPGAPILMLSQYVDVSYADAVVRRPDLHAAGVEDVDANGGDLGLTVLGDIRERLGDDEIDRRFHGR